MSKIQELLLGKTDQIHYEEIIKNYPWIIKKGQNCILSPDSDGLLCGLFMLAYLDWEIKGFYDGKIMLLDKDTPVKDCVFLDMEIFREEIKSVGHHMMQFNKNKKLQSEILETEINNTSLTTKIILAKPQTFMNNSGKAVKALADYYKIKNNNIIIIYDELDLPFGKIRVRNRGSSAGHNGIKSIIQHLNTEDFLRIRIGIANKFREKILSEIFVLKKFSRDEYKELQNKILPEVVGKIKEIIK